VSAALPETRREPVAATGRDGGARVCAAVVSHLPYDARVWKEARSLAAAGYEVDLLGMRYGIAAPQTRVEDGVRVTELPFGDGHGAHSASPLKRVRVLFSLWGRILRTPAAIYHCHNVHVAPPVLAAALVRRAEIVYDAHELYGEVKPGAGLGSRISARLTRLAERVVVRRARRVITTNASRALVMAERYPRATIVPVANVPNLVEEVDPLDPGFPPGAPVLLYQGGIYAEARAFEAMVAALPLLPDVHLCIVGFGRDRDKRLIVEWSERHGVAERVHLFGPVPFEDLVGVAAAATVGIVPLRNISMNSYLGDTNKLFEYMMAGLPVVGSNFPEVARVLESGDPRPGETFDPESPASIAASVEAVISDRYEQRRERARRLAVDEHCWHHEEPKLLECFENERPQRR
jgi:glycosyltransferase involved in cell wall biosynthesis